jgi:hypothetical protein
MVPDGLLRRLAPLSLAEQQCVHPTITDLPNFEEVRSRTTEQKWLAAHSHDYCGQWVALEGDALLGHGADARSVATKRAKEVSIAPEEPDLPSAAWLWT